MSQTIHYNDQSQRVKGQGHMLNVHQSPKYLRGHRIRRMQRLQSVEYVLRAS